MRGNQFISSVIVQLSLGQAPFLLTVKLTLFTNATFFKSFSPGLEEQVCWNKYQ